MWVTFDILSSFFFHLFDEFLPQFLVYTFVFFGIGTFTFVAIGTIRGFWVTGLWVTGLQVKGGLWLVLRLQNLLLKLTLIFHKFGNHLGQIRGC